MSLLTELQTFHVDIQDGLRRFMNNTALYEKMLKKFPAAAEGLPVQEHFDSGNLETALANAHTLKGMTGNLSLTPLYESYTEIVALLRANDPEKAKALLEKAGWTLPAGKDIREKNGQPLRIELSFIGTDALSKSMAEIIQADMRQIGADVSLIGEEESSIYARQRDGRFGMIFHRTWGAPYDPHAFLSSMRVPSHADFQAQQGLADKPLIDKEIGEVLATHDETQRQALYRDILTRLHDEAVYLPISYISMMVVSKPELGNIPYAPIATEIPFEQIKPVKP